MTSIEVSLAPTTCNINHSAVLSPLSSHSSLPEKEQNETTPARQKKTNCWCATEDAEARPRPSSLSQWGAITSPVIGWDRSAVTSRKRRDIGFTYTTLEFSRERLPNTASGVYGKLRIPVNDLCCRRVRRETGAHSGSRQGVENVIDLLCAPSQRMPPHLRTYLVVSFDRNQSVLWPITWLVPFMSAREWE
ncbi:hypothetical protein N657DRAFT_475372 [Parathielavia appendiculata]|uniref:Uncharacterized protein n=1 Tax=Parathielavia appendiculata TaxID=2587402 RepID=A0AAN6TYY1_9PEZI|nr:hypothetical protein N657DRAFT_475372 [Parathielavia appendiculata]